MRNIGIAVLVIFAFAGRLKAQDSTVRIAAILIDTSLDQKPAPRMTIVFTPEDTSHKTQEVKTEFDGTAEVSLPPGTYNVNTPDGTDFQGHQANISHNAPPGVLFSLAVYVVESLR